VAMRTIRDGKIERLDAVAPGTPKPLVEAIDWALENRRDKRATAVELTQALEAFIKSSPELATSMQLAGWVRARFPREATGQMQAIETPPGTVAVPGTVAGAATPASGIAFVTPSRLIGASRISAGDESSGPESGTSIFVAAKDLIDGDTLKRKPFPPLSNETIVDRRGPDAPTQMATTNPTLRDSDTRIDATSDTDDDLNYDETIERSAPDMMPPRPSPTLPLSLSPSVIVAPPSGPRVAPSAGHAQLAAHAHAGRRKVPSIDPARMRIIVAACGLVGLALISFLVALAAKGSHSSTPPPADARALAAVVPIADAATPDAAIADAQVATVPIDATAPPAEAFLEVSTFPPGGTVHVGDQSRVAPAQLVVQAGTIGVDAELDGYAPVHRDETVEAGEHRTVEIAFMHKLPAPRAPAVGKLTVHTSPPADVFENGKKIGETPFIDHELSAGTHVLTFKNSLHPTVTKKVVIQPGKVAKLNFDLP
ncbi:MAG TPA: PEGA domain-containing protein, partial [Kofleriaceae bacterium]